MDTTTINYAINKIQSGVESMLPTVQGLTTEYIEFIVANQVMSSVISLGLVLLSIIIFIPSLIVIYNDRDNQNVTPVVSTILICISAMMFFVTSIDSLVNIKPTYMAIKYPKMFVADKVIKAK